MLLGLVGNVLVSLAWFGAALLGPLYSSRSYGVGDNLVVRLLLGFVAAQALLFAAGLAPAGWLRRSVAR